MPVIQSFCEHYFINNYYFRSKLLTLEIFNYPLSSFSPGLMPGLRINTYIFSIKPLMPPISISTHIFSY
jgi:hypothetical protein